MLDKSCSENQNKFDVQKLFSENLAFFKCAEKHGMCRQAIDDNIMLCRNYVICIQGN